MYLQQKGNGGHAKEVLATGFIESVVSHEGSTVLTVLVETLDLASAKTVRSTVALAFTVGEMAMLAEAYDCGMDVEDENDEAIQE